MTHTAHAPLIAYLDAQRLSLEFVGAADAWAAGWGSSLQELVPASIALLVNDEEHPCKGAPSATQTPGWYRCSFWGITLANLY